MRIGRLMTGLVGLVALTMLLAGGVGAEGTEAYAGEAYQEKEKGNKKCNDGIDNDGDGKIDDKDPDCGGGPSGGGGATPQEAIYLLTFTGTNVFAALDGVLTGTMRADGQLGGNVFSGAGFPVCLRGLEDDALATSGHPAGVHLVQPLGDGCVDPWFKGKVADLRSMKVGDMERMRLDIRWMANGTDGLDPLPWASRKRTWSWVLRWVNPPFTVLSPEDINERAGSLEVTRTGPNLWEVTDPLGRNVTLQESILPGNGKPTLTDEEKRIFHQVNLPGFGFFLECMDANECLPPN